MTYCRRCHRAISNPKSVQHGFGPDCWNKLQDQPYDERPASLRITIIDQALAQKSLAEIRELMKSAERQTCKCGEPLDTANIEYYDHEGGYDLPGFGKPQWLYHHCEKCNYDYSLWKLGIQYDPTPPESPVTGSQLKPNQKYAVVIIDTEKDEHGEYIPCIVKEDEQGYYPTTWKWGKDIELAKRLADDYNAKLGISKEEAIKLTLESMRPKHDIECLSTLVDEENPTGEIRTVTCESD